VEKDSDTIVQSLYTGADDYVEIPFEPAVLVAKATRLVEVNRLAEKLHEEKERLRIAVAAARMGMWEWNIGSGSVFWSKDLERIHGLSPGRFGGTFESFLEQIHPDDRELVKTCLSRTVNDGSDHDIEYRIIWPDNSVHWVEGRGSVIQSRNGKPLKMIGLCMDVTDRKQEEELLRLTNEELEKRVEERTTQHRQLEEQFLQSQKLEAVGRLAGGIAHDFNNLLTAILGYSQLSLRRLPDKDPVRRNLEEIQKASDRAASLTRQLLAFSRKQLMQPIVLNLNAVIKDLEQMLRRLIGEDIEFLISLNPDLGNIKADPSQVEQVVMNLVVNSRDAMHAGGKLTIETSNQYLDKTYSELHVGVVPGMYAMLAVSDTGTGMDQQTQQHIFEPFFTTKEDTEGTGLGLSTVYGIVKQSGGSVWVYSEKNKGSTFKIYFPLVSDIAEDYKQTPITHDLPHGNETILLVEDDDAVRKLAREVLQISGYRVLEAANGEAALKIFEQEKPIHLVLTDVVMPAMGGRQLVERLLSINSEITVLYMSGYTENLMTLQGILEQGAHFIPKPFSPDGLALKVREVLDLHMQKENP
jgi:PAS domain S-box-containing protein